MNRGRVRRRRGAVYEVSRYGVMGSVETALEVSSVGEALFPRSHRRETLERRLERLDYKKTFDWRSLSDDGPRWRFGHPAERPAREADRPSSFTVHRNGRPIPIERMTDSELDRYLSGARQPDDERKESPSEPGSAACCIMEETPE